MSAASLTVQEVATAADQRPSLPRSGHSAAPLPAWHDADAIIFGGYVEEADKKTRRCTSEAWTFSAAAGAWSAVTYAEGCELPPPRLVAQTVVVGDKLWLIGGWNSNVQGPDAFLSDVWTLDLRTWAWQRVELQGEQLPAISRHQAAAVGNKIYIHTHRNEADILVLDTVAQPPTLSSVPVQGPAPPSRGLHTMVAVGGEALLVYGGAPQKGPMFDDLWRLDLKTMQWQQLQPSGATPHARCSTAAASLGDGRILFVGGAFYGASGGLEMLGDAQVLDLSAGAPGSWVAPQLAAGSALPSARNASVLMALHDKSGGDASKRRLLMYGGWRAFVESYNDTFLIEC